MDPGLSIATSNPVYSMLCAAPLLSLAAVILVMKPSVVVRVFMVVTTAIGDYNFTKAC